MIMYRNESELVNNRKIYSLKDLKHGDVFVFNFPFDENEIFLVIQKLDSESPIYLNLKTFNLYSFDLEEKVLKYNGDIQILLNFKDFY